MATAADYETTRLVVRELRDDDLESALAVYTSNPQYLELTEGSGGVPGRYDLDMLRRDVALARITPGRRIAGLFLRGTSEPVGVLDCMAENPADGEFWIGSIVVRADHQRAGLAAEALEGLAHELRAAGVDAVRAAVVARNTAGRSLAQRLDFEPVSTTVKSMAGGSEEVVVLERRLG